MRLFGHLERRWRHLRGFSGFRFILAILVLILLICLIGVANAFVEDFEDGSYKDTYNIHQVTYIYHINKIRTIDVSSNKDHYYSFTISHYDVGDYNFVISQKNISPSNFYVFYVKNIDYTTDICYLNFQIYDSKGDLKIIYRNSIKGNGYIIFKMYGDTLYIFCKTRWIHKATKNI